MIECEVACLGQLLGNMLCKMYTDLTRLWAMYFTKYDTITCPTSAREHLFVIYASLEEEFQVRLGSPGLVPLINEITKNDLILL